MNDSEGDCDSIAPHTDCDTSGHLYERTMNGYACTVCGHVSVHADRSAGIVSGERQFSAWAVIRAALGVAGTGSAENYEDWSARMDAMARVLADQIHAHYMPECRTALASGAGRAAGVTVEGA